MRSIDLSPRHAAGPFFGIKNFPSLLLSALTTFSVCTAYSEDLIVGKTCPVTYHGSSLGVLVLSKPWFHSSRLDAAYQAMDNATGIGTEIHLFASFDGDTRYRNIANCKRYRLLQVRKTTARLLEGEKKIQIDLPQAAKEPFSDSDPLEYGHGTHLTPSDSRDKPWQGRVVRASTVALYDTPYVTDYFGVEGKDIEVVFETCAVCEREESFDSLLSCVRWGYRRDYMGGFTGWAEPELLPMQCSTHLSGEFADAIGQSDALSYTYGRDWR